MKKIFTFLITSAVLSGVQAQTRTTVQNGNATNPLTWDCTCIPVPGNDIVINHQLTLDTDFAYTSGSVTVNSGAAINGNSPQRILGVGGGTFTNNGSVTVANMYHSAGTFNNNGTMNVSNSFASDQTAQTQNNGSVTITDTLYINTNAKFTNSGTLNAPVTASAGHLHNEGNFTGTDIWATGMTMHVTGSFSISNLYNSGSFSTSAPASISNDLWNSENATIGHDLTIGHSLYNGDTTGGPANFTNNGLISVVQDFVNSKTVAGTGKFCIGQSTTNSGAINGTLDFCDQTGGAIDFNSGTVAGTVTFCATSCNLGVTEQSKDNITVYPNPFNNQFTIKTGRAGAYRVQLVNAIGQIMLDQAFNSDQIRLDATYLPEGIYFYRLVTDTSLVSTGRLIKR